MPMKIRKKDFGFRHPFAPATSVCVTGRDFVLWRDPAPSAGRACAVFLTCGIRGIPCLFHLAFGGKSEVLCRIWSAHGEARSEIDALVPYGIDFSSENAEFSFILSANSCKNREVCGIIKGGVVLLVQRRGAYPSPERNIVYENWNAGLWLYGKDSYVVS